MTLPGGGLRLQTLGGLAAQLFDSTLRTFVRVADTLAAEVMSIVNNADNDIE